MDEALSNPEGKVSNEAVSPKPTDVNSQQEHENGAVEIKSIITASETVPEQVRDSSDTGKVVSGGDTVFEKAPDANGTGKTMPVDAVSGKAPASSTGEGTVSEDTVSDGVPARNSGDQGDASVGCRVQLQNLPRYMGHKQVKTFLAKHLDKASLRKIRMFSDTVYFNLPTKEEANRAVEALNGFKIKNKEILAKICAPEPMKGRDIPRNQSEAPSKKSAKEIVTPLADVNYEEQLDRKMSDAKRIATTLVRNMVQANIKNARAINAWNLVQPIRRSPRTEGYRNKCEFTVGRDIEGKVCVGFVGGRFAANMHFILPMDTCTNISQRMKDIVNNFQKFVVDSGEETFNEFERRGVWKMLTVREFTEDVMIIVTVFPMEDTAKEDSLKSSVIERFLKRDSSSDEDNKLRVTSIYWQRLANASDPLIYDHIAGSPFIYETILDTRFRISPGAFFQTNSSGASVLYSTIAEKAGLLDTDSAAINANSAESEETSGTCIREEPTKVDESGDVDNSVKEDEPAAESRADETGTEEKVETKKEASEVPAIPTTVAESANKCQTEDGICSEEHDEGVVAKKRRVDDGENASMDTSEGSGSKPTVILDVCCGTGTIGLCLMSLLKHSKTEGRRFLFGVEMVPQAIEDAKCNAVENAFNEDDYRFVAGKAEEVFRSLRSYVPSSVKLDAARVVGILDPPRAGIHEKVVVGCRTLSSLRRLVFVSCEPSLALKNLVDLCRPTSKKYEGEPFRVTSITPVDMFPHTKHCEWVVQLDR